MKEISLEEILLKHTFNSTVDTLKEDSLSAMKEACKQVLELAAENAELENVVKVIGSQNKYNAVVPIIKKQSILDTINQVK